MDEAEEFVGTLEAAQVLDVSVDYIRKLCQRGELPCYRVGGTGHYRFLVSELRAWIRGEFDREKGQWKS